MNGSSASLAGVRSKSKIRVGRYGVELPGFEQFVDEELTRDPGDVDLFVIDELFKTGQFDAIPANAYLGLGPDAGQRR
ncbi:nucleoside-triphosphatase [Haliangium sp.]|uniref:nucleoside-triphosphatase n=1 Tax=Haliangium sp. TaxID=2663208 RepID=UPI003D0BC655